MISLIDLFLGRKKTTANVAKERLQIILAHERSSVGEHEDGGAPSWLPRLQQELVEVIARYVKINPEDLKVNLERKDNLELLEINVALPEERL